MPWIATGRTDFPILEDESWDGDQAREQIFRWAGWPDDPQPSKARQCFFAMNTDAPENKGSYKLPFCKIVDGEPKASWRGIIAVAQVLQGARGGADLPAGVIAKTKMKVGRYYRRMKQTPPWEKSLRLEEDDDVWVVEGWAAVFNEQDLVGDVFDDNGEYVPEGQEVTVPLLWEHGRDEMIGAEPIGEAVLKRTPFGIWAKAFIKAKELYQRLVEEDFLALIKEALENGELGFSMGTVKHPNYFLREEKDNVGVIKRFIPVELSLTPVPTEPATLGVSFAKSLGVEVEEEEVGGSNEESVVEKHVEVNRNDPEPDGGNKDEVVLENIRGDIATNEEPNQVVVKNVSMSKSQEDTETEEAVAKHMNESIHQEEDQMEEKAIHELVRRYVQEAMEGLSNQLQYQAPREEKQATFGQFLIAVKESDRVVLKDMGSVFKAVTGDSGASGGWLVPPEQLDPIWAAIRDQQPFLERAREIPMGSDEALVPLMDPSASASGTTVTVAGVTAAWVGRSGNAPESAPQWEMAHMRAHPLRGVAYVANGYLAQVGDRYEQWLRSAFVEVVRRMINRAFVLGSGQGEPLGILNAPAALDVTRSAANDFTWADAVDMYTKLPDEEGIEGRAAWFVSRSVFAKLLNMVGPSSLVTYVEDVKNKPQLRLLGLPVVVTSAQPALGTRGDVILADLGYYYWGTPREIMVAASEHAQFVADQTVYRVTASVAGMPAITKPITLENGDQVSPFVVLA